MDCSTHHLLYNQIPTVTQIGHAIQMTEGLLAAMEFFFVQKPSFLELQETKCGLSFEYRSRVPFNGTCYS